MPDNRAEARFHELNSIGTFKDIKVEKTDNGEEEYELVGHIQ